MDRKTQAYEYLKNAIIQNDMPPGSSIKETELSKILGMSRTPIREALKELEGEGVVVSYPARGCFVAPVSPLDVEEIYELRSVWELFALEKSFYRFTEDELNKMEAAFNRAFHEKDWQAMNEADACFHEMIVLKSGHRRLAAVSNLFGTQVNRIRRFGPLDSKRIESSYREHTEIISLIREKDLPACKEALQKHLRAVADSAIETAKMMETLPDIRPMF